MSKLKDVFCVYEYDIPTSKIKKALINEKPEIEYVLDQMRKSVDELDERWNDTRSISHNISVVANQKRNRSMTSQLEDSTRYSRNTCIY